MLFDYHIHTTRCKHAVGTMEEYVQAAIAAGLSEIGFSDHLPLPRSGPSPWNMLPDELPLYVAEVLALREKYAPFPIRLAVEADYLEAHLDQTRALLARYPWDYVIASCHHLAAGAISHDPLEPASEWCIDSPEELAQWERQDVDTAWRAYLKVLARMAASGIGQIIGHCDLPKKFNYRPKGDMTAAYRETAAAFAQAGVVVELNTAGLRKPAAEIYPSLPFLRVLHEANVPITLGSDSHAPQEVGYAIDKAIAHAKAAGYTSIHKWVSPRKFEPVQL